MTGILISDVDNEIINFAKSDFTHYAPPRNRPLSLGLTQETVGDE